VFEVPADFEEFLARISIKERRNVRRDERQLLQRGGEVRRPTNAVEIDTQLSVLARLHQEHWKLHGRMGHFDDVPGIAAFYREVACSALPAGRLGMLEVSAGGDTLAAEFALRFNGRLHWIIGGRREDVTARVGFCCLMREAITDRVSLIDGLAGEYDYKRRLGAAQLSLKNLYVVPHGATSALRLRATRSVLRVVSLVYHKVWFWRVAPWIMRRAPHLGAVIVPRGLWERFARSRFLVADRRPVSQAPVDEGDPD
jgi:CelD/BcsL family acetyltransferase involved in cellulose biosynthesis